MLHVFIVSTAKTHPDDEVAQNQKLLGAACGTHLVVVYWFKSEIQNLRSKTSRLQLAYVSATPTWLAHSGNSVKSQKCAAPKPPWNYNTSLSSASVKQIAWLVCVLAACVGLRRVGWEKKSYRWQSELAARERRLARAS